jgi:hypothetical protein
MTFSINNPTKTDMPDDERRRLLLQKPEVYVKVMQMAESLTKNLASHIEVLIDMPVGAKFRDVETGTQYTYEAIATPLKHGDLINLVCTAAHQDLEELTNMTYFLIREFIPAEPRIILDGVPPLPTPAMTPLKVINGRDLVKYFVVGKWALLEKPTKINADEFAEELDVLRRTENP